MPEKIVKRTQFNFGNISYYKYPAQNMIFSRLPPLKMRTSESAVFEA